MRLSKTPKIFLFFSQNPLTKAPGSGIMCTERERERNPKMNAYRLNPLANRQYANNGQHLEQTYRFNKSGMIEKADNRENAPDYENVQIKSARATICKGTDYEKAIRENPAEIFAYITADLICYEMDKNEFVEFVAEFGAVTRESNANGGAEKVRLNKESKALLGWLALRA